MTIKAIAPTPPIAAPTIKPMLLFFFVSDDEVCEEEAAVAVNVASPFVAV